MKFDENALGQMSAHKCTVIQKELRSHTRSDALVMLLEYRCEEHGATYCVPMLQEAINGNVGFAVVLYIGRDKDSAVVHYKAAEEYIETIGMFNENRLFKLERMNNNAGH